MAGVEISGLPLDEYNDLCRPAGEHQGWRHLSFIILLNANFIIVLNVNPVIIVHTNRYLNQALRSVVNADCFVLTAEGLYTEISWVITFY